jgi:hypothetical protein
MRSSQARIGLGPKENIMIRRKLLTGRVRSWLVGSTLALGLALTLVGCVVEAGGPYREHWHGWHEWR